jgi:hypothetical protein
MLTEWLAIFPLNNVDSGAFPLGRFELSLGFQSSAHGSRSDRGISDITEGENKMNEVELKVLTVRDNLLESNLFPQTHDEKIPKRKTRSTSVSLTPVLRLEERKRYKIN